MFMKNGELVFGKSAPRYSRKQPLIVDFDSAVNVLYDYKREASAIKIDLALKRLQQPYFTRSIKIAGNALKRKE